MNVVWNMEEPLSADLQEEFIENINSWISLHQSKFKNNF
jgi:hypothetical protein